ncbi:uncharacterized protein DDB_G0283357-like [Eleutherodactylus coqui]|uniref:uncharacterized protein DDB_G0283357-like n=1 Tax=Eleutherodactylus coqui TaxID=57060 RepID=UPI0034636090
MMTEEEIGFSVQDTSGEPMSREMDSGCEMMTKHKIGVPVQDTLGESMRVVPFCLPAALSIKTTEPSTSHKSHGSKPEDSGDNNAISAENCKYENDAINIDITLGDRCASEDSGCDRKISCLNSKAPEAFEDRSRTEDTSMRLDDLTMSCALENSASIAPLSGDSSVVGLGEDNFAPKGSISIETELLDTDHNGDEGSRSSDGTFAYHEDNKNFSLANHIERNASNFKTNDNTISDAYSSTTYSELQDVADVDKNKDREQENKPSTELHKDNNVKDVITSDDPRTMSLMSENSTTKSLDNDYFLTEIHRSTNIDNEFCEPKNNGDGESRPNDDILVHHEVNNGYSADSQTGGNVFNIKTDVSSNTDAYNTITYSKLQGGGNSDKNKATDAENKTSTDHGRDNIDFSCHGPKIKEEKSKAFDDTSTNDNSFTGHQRDNNVTRVLESGDHTTRSYTNIILKLENSTTAGLEEDNFALEGHRSNNISSELLQPEHNGDIPAHLEFNYSYSAASQTGGNGSNIKAVSSCTDAYSITAYRKLQGGANLDKNKAIAPENKTSIDHRRGKVDFSCHGQIIKLEKSKASNDRSPNDNSSTGLQLDNNITKVIKLDDHTTTSDTTMILKSENSSSAGLEEDNFAPESHGSNNIFTELLEPKHNIDMGSRPSDDLFAQHEVNNDFSIGSHSGTNASIHCGCNQNTNSFETDEDTHVDVHPGRKRSNLNCSDNKLSIDHNPKDNTSPGYGSDKKGLSIRRLNSQDQTQAITKSPNALAPTSPTYFQQDGEVTNLDDPVSLPRGAEIRSPCESKTDKQKYSIKSSWVYKIVFLLMIVLLVAPVTVQASSQWQLHRFNITNRKVLHQSWTIMNMENRDSPGCTFNVTAFPFWYNCPQSGDLVFAYNETCIEMVTKDLSTNVYNLEHGNGLNGHNLQATRGERLDDKSIEDKKAGITKPTDSTPRTLDDTKPTDSTPRAQTPEDTDHTKWIIVGVVVGLVAFIALVSLYIFCQSFRRWVQSSISSCRRRNTNNVPEADAGHNLEMEALASPTTNGSVNGHLGTEV